jgi:hypothetical protein
MRVELRQRYSLVNYTAPLSLLGRFYQGISLKRDTRERCLGRPKLVGQNIPQQAAKAGESPRTPAGLQGSLQLTAGQGRDRFPFHVASLRPNFTVDHRIGRKRAAAGQDPGGRDSVLIGR